MHKILPISMIIEHIINLSVNTTSKGYNKHNIMKDIESYEQGFNIVYLSNTIVCRLLQRGLEL